MKKILAILALLTAPLFADDLMLKYEAAVKMVQPADAVSALKEVYADALKVKSWDMVLVTLDKVVALEAVIEQDERPNASIIRLDALRQTAPDEVKPLLEIPAIEWYWMCFKKNELFLNTARKEPGEGDAGENVATWSGPRLLKEVNDRFTRLLSDPRTLARYPASQFPNSFPSKRLTGIYDYPHPPDAVERDPTTPLLNDIYRPTLYDIVARRAIDFYSDPYCYMGGDEFKQKTWELFDAIAAWNKQQSNIIAYANICLERLRLECAQRESDTLDKENMAGITCAAFAGFIEREQTEVSARARAALAQKLFELKKYPQAVEVATQGINTYPDSIGAKECRAVIQSIKHPSFSITSRDVWALTKPETQPYGTIHITARNVQKIHFRLYATAVDLSKTYFWAWRNPSREEVIKICKAIPAQTFTVDMPQDTPYEEIKFNYAVPKPVKGGIYYLVASLKDDSEWEHWNKDDIVDCRAIQVSDLAIDTSQINDALLVRVFDADSGKPLLGASVTVFYGKTQTAQLQTDSFGQVQLDLKDKETAAVLVRQGEDALIHWAKYTSKYRYHDEQQTDQTLLTLDSHLYRPGQTVYYKGICYTANAETGTYTVRPNATYTIRMTDSSWQEVESHEGTANEFGSFSGSFVIPKERGTGRYSLRIDHVKEIFSVQNDTLTATPFKVLFDPLNPKYRVGDEVRLTGCVQRPNGRLVSNAKITWRVTRAAFYPWWNYRSPTPYLIIAGGETLTDEQGNYMLPFKVEPLPNAAFADEPTYRFEFILDVVDATGEKCTEFHKAALGFAALKANITAPNIIEAGQPLQIELNTCTLSENPIAGEGELLIRQLQPPKRPTPASIAENEKKNPNQSFNWPIGKTLFSLPFKSDATGQTSVEATLPTGVYLLEVKAKDQFGTPVISKAFVTVIDPTAKKSSVGVTDVLYCKTNIVEVGETFRAIWGTGYPTAYCEAEIYHDSKLVKRWTNKPEDTQLLIEYPVTEALRGGFVLRTVMVREGEKYEQNVVVEVPRSNRKLQLEWLHMRSKLTPGDKEKWVLSVKRPDGSPAKAEVLGCMFDATHFFTIVNQWLTFNRYGEAHPYSRPRFTSQKSESFYSETMTQTSWEMPWRIWNDELLKRSPIIKIEQAARAKEHPAHDSLVASPPLPGERCWNSKGDAQMSSMIHPWELTGIIRDKEEQPREFLNAQRNLSEMGFFLPHQKTDEKGNAVFEFATPEAAAKWKVRILAHEKNLSFGYLETDVVTQRELMLESNFPNFLHEDDVIDFPIKLTNTSETNQIGQVSLVFRDGQSGVVNTALFIAEGAEQTFTLKPRETKAFSWRIKVPDRAAGTLHYTIIAKGIGCGDGEEASLPILSRRIQRTESLTFAVRPNQNKTFKMKPLLNMAKLKGIENSNFTLEIVPNTTWAALLSLPHLMTEQPDECTEQLFHRYYANTLARHILQQNPKIEKTLRQWQTLKKFKQRDDIALLLDQRRAQDESRDAMARLRAIQGGCDLWPWFEGGPDNIWASIKIVTGVGRLRKLGVQGIDLKPINDTIGRLDSMCCNRVKIAQDNKAPLVIMPDDVNYLYARTFFLEDIKPSETCGLAIRDLLKSAVDQWQKFPLYTRAQLAIALFRFGDAETAKLICKSMQENAVESEELGMYWKLTRSWWWYEAPIETQAMVMEAFREVTQDQKLVDECALWLLQQKRTSRWPTTVSTAHAVYAILLSSNAPLTDSAAVQVKLGAELTEPARAEPDSGYFSESFAKDQIKPELGRIEVNNPHNRVVFGGLHWQYLQDIGEVTASDDALPLRIKRELFKREVTAAGNVLKPLDVALQQGDTVVTRIELRVDRDMEFVHLKDTRAANLEPVDVLSSYRWQDGVGYFQSTRDTATHFFFDRLPRGTYVFEYDCSVFQNGTCNAGLAEVQCMYAPEFNAHSQGRSIQSEKAR